MDERLGVLAVRFGIVTGLQAVEDALKGAQVEQDVDQGVEIGYGGAVAQLGMLDTETERLAEEAFGGGVLGIDRWLGFGVAIELQAETCAETGGQRDDAAALGPVGICHRRGINGRLRVL